MSFADLDRRIRAKQQQAKGEWEKLKGKANDKIADVEGAIKETTQD